MDIYTVYCTTEQTKKALKLGAPIATHWSIMTNDWIYDNPLTEQMIWWLEERNMFCEIRHYEYFHHSYVNGKYLGHFSSRKEATLAAIDAALDYLSNNNLKK